MTSPVAQEIRQLLVESTSLAAIDDATLAEGPKEMVLAALDGSQALARLIDDDVRVERPSESAAAASEPKRAYLSQLTVTGFRGIGAQVKLPLAPAPGLTVITGRNGSGKSSLVEALELALTGETARPDSVSKDNRRVWRNRHYSVDASIQVELAVESEGMTTVGVDWTADAEPDSFKPWAQRPKLKREWGSDPLGWQAPLQMFRPILTYDETGRVFDKPSALFDALDRVLGLNDLTTTAKLLKDAHTEKAPLRKTADAQKRALRKELKESGSDDERVVTALRKLGQHKLDVDGLAQLATGSGDTDPAAAALKRLAQRQVPDAGQISSAFQELNNATSAVADLAVTDSERMRARLDILRAAITYRGDDDTDCMVCGEGTLDAAWLESVRAELDAAPPADLIDDARARRAAAARAVDALLEQLSRQPETGGVELAGLTEVTTHLATKPTKPADAEVWALRAADLLQQIVAAADVEAGKRDDAWLKFALPLGEWVQAERAAAPTDHIVADLLAAHKWVTTYTNALRTKRTERIGNEACEIWGMLKQESSVQLEDVRLEGAPGSTQRKVRLRASIDGEVDDDNDAALAIMSQGELNALSLALFIPRATAEQSPFRFLLLDDPIQAMDPTKVDGFVTMLQKLSETRQVIVFSHDDRLPTAISQLNVEATVLGVTRKAQSTVTVDRIDDPTTRYVADAFALLNDTEVPHDVKVATIPGLCRTALETAARQVFYVRGYRNGLSRDELEGKWQNAHEVRRRIQLASSSAFDPVDDSWVGKPSQKDVRAAITFCNAGAHGDLNAVEKSDIRGVERATAALAELR